MLPRTKSILVRWDQLFELVEDGLSAEPGRAEGQAHAEAWEDFQPKDSRSLGWDLHLKGEWPALARLWNEMHASGEITEAQWEGGEIWYLPTLIMAPEITWAGTPISEPAVGVGMTVAYKLQWPPGLQEGDSLRLAAESAGFRFGTTWRGTIGRIFRTKELADVADADATLEQQAQRIITWARAALTDLSAVTSEGELPGP